MESWQRQTRKRRAKRVKKMQSKIRGTADRPRLCINKTSKHLYAQVIDDGASKSLCAISTLTPAMRAKGYGRKNKENAVAIGMYMVEKLKLAGVAALVVDRRHSGYHGVIGCFVDVLREHGINV